MNTRGNKRTRPLKHALAALLVLAALLTCLIPTAWAAEEAKGECGPQLRWSYADGVLTLTGSGEMSDFADGIFAPWYEYAPEIRAVSLPKGLTRVGSLAFYGCEALAEVTLPDSVTAIGRDAFHGCAGIRTVRFSQSLTSIGENAFRECGSLMTLRLPDTLEQIGTQAFYRCASLHSATVPASVTQMGTGVFAYCYDLVRAEIYAQTTQLPAWTFYGCEKLSDVVLSQEITTTEENAFQGCDGLNTVYTQTYDQQVAGSLEREIAADSDGFAEQGYVAAYEPPDRSRSVTEAADGTMTALETIRTAGADITVKTTTGPNGEGKTQIDAVIETPEGGDQLSEVVSQVLEQPGTGKITVDVADSGSGLALRGRVLNALADRDVILRLHSGSGAVWKLDMSGGNQAQDREYDMTVTVAPQDAGFAGLSGEAFYQVDFAGSTDFNAVLRLPLDPKWAYEIASLCQKDGKDYTPVQSVVVDGTGVAEFRLGATQKNTKYCVGIRLEGIEDEPMVPETLYENYGITDATLMDENGTAYVITGRTSSWGVGLGTVMAILGVVMLFALLLVGLIMTLLHRRKKGKEYYAAKLAQETQEDLDEVELQLKVMKEMLEEDSDGKK